MPQGEANYTTSQTAGAVAAYRARDPENDLAEAGSGTRGSRRRARVPSAKPVASARIASARRLVELYPDLFSVPSLQRWRTVGIGPPFHIVGPRRIAYDLDEVEEWIASRRATSTADAKERGLAS